MGPMRGPLFWVPLLAGWVWTIQVERATYPRTNPSALGHAGLSNHLKNPLLSLGPICRRQLGLFINQAKVTWLIHKLGLIHLDGMSCFCCYLRKLIIDERGSRLLDLPKNHQLLGNWV